MLAAFVSRLAEHTSLTIASKRPFCNRKTPSEARRVAPTFRSAFDHHVDVALKAYGPSYL